VAGADSAGSVAGADSGDGGASGTIPGPQQLGSDR
jgi:hypothetical protein